MQTDLQEGEGALGVLTSNHIIITIFLPLFFL